MPITVTAAVGAVTEVANTISQVVDRDKRRRYEQNLASLDYEQKVALGKLLQKQTSEDAKLQIVAETLGSLNTARINALTQIQVEKERTKKYLYVALAVGAAVVIAVSVYFFKKNNKK